MTSPQIAQRQHSIANLRHDAQWLTKISLVELPHAWSTDAVGSVDGLLPQFLDFFYEPLVKAGHSLPSLRIVSLVWTKQQAPAHPNPPAC